MAEDAGLFIKLYIDEDVTNELAVALRDRGFEAESAADAGLLNADDDAQLAHAAANNMALLTYNVQDYPALGQQYSEEGRSHSGIVVSSDQYGRRQFGTLLRLVLHLLNALSADELIDRIVFLQQFK
jgi:predicted nuclease of predicted toxin-antitoxin system